MVEARRRLEAVPAGRSPRVPEHLAKATGAWWAHVVAEWSLDEHHVRLLTFAAEAWDRAEQARRAIAEHGLVFTDRFGSPRARPEVAIERDSRIAFARLLRELDLHDETQASPLALRRRRR